MKTLEEYKRLPYTLYAQPLTDTNGSRYWTAEYLELRGCKTDGNTEAEAIANLHTLFDDYITSLLEENIEIAEPEKSQAPQIEEITIIRRGKVFQTLPPETAKTEKTKDMVSAKYDEAVV